MNLFPFSKNDGRNSTENVVDERAEFFDSCCAPKTHDGWVTVIENKEGGYLDGLTFTMSREGQRTEPAPLTLTLDVRGWGTDSPPSRTIRIYWSNFAGGMDKTELARRAVEKLRSRFPEHQIMVDMSEAREESVGVWTALAAEGLVDFPSGEDYRRAMEKHDEALSQDMTGQQE